MSVHRESEALPTKEQTVAAEHDNGGPAFPLTGDAVSYTNGGFAMQGMSLEDYYAGQALAGQVANADFANTTTQKEHADLAYQMAAAMIREKRRREAQDAPDVAAEKARLRPEWEKLPEPRPDFDAWFIRVMQQGE